MLPILTLIAVGFLQAPVQGALRFTAPQEWTIRPASSTMRLAEYVLPRAAGDTEDGELIVYFFGGSGGSVEANIDRWLGQFQQPDGRASRDVATRANRVINGLNVTTLDLGGTYLAEVRPGSSERHNKPGFWMRAAVVTTPRGPYYVKAVGPAKTMARWKDGLDAFISSVRVE
jgi:hypothetical protein